MAKQRFTAAQVAAALIETRGLVTLAVKRLGCVPQTVANYVDRYQVVKQAKDDARDELIDLAEQRLYEAVDRGDSWAIPFTLKTIGRHRGYTERPEVDEAADGKIIVEYVDDWKGQTPGVASSSGHGDNGADSP